MARVITYKAAGLAMQVTKQPVTAIGREQCFVLGGRQEHGTTTAESLFRPLNFAFFALYLGAS